MAYNTELMVKMERSFIWLQRMKKLNLKTVCKILVKMIFLDILEDGIVIHEEDAGNRNEFLDRSAAFQSREQKQAIKMEMSKFTCVFNITNYCFRSEYGNSTRTRYCNQ